MNFAQRIRWSDNDRYWGPFTYARERGTERGITIMLGSGDGDDYPGCRLRLGGFGHTLIIALPQILKPWREWVEIRTEPTRGEMIAEGRNPGYWDMHAREFGFSVFEGAIHVHYGPQMHDSTTDKVKVYFLPWRSWRHVRRSLYDLDGQHFADLPHQRGMAKLGTNAWHNSWAVQKAIEDACPSSSFDFDDYDGERITAVTRIEEREWLLGEGKFKWLSWFRRPNISRSLDIQFLKETGARKGSWKGGTIGHSIAMLPGELHEAAFRRYCAEHQMTFVGKSEGQPA
jgi:hypothetical protein